MVFKRKDYLNKTELQKIEKFSIISPVNKGIAKKDIDNLDSLILKEIDQYVLDQNYFMICELSGVLLTNVMFNKFIENKVSKLKYMLSHSLIANYRFNNPYYHVYRSLLMKLP